MLLFLAVVAMLLVFLWFIPKQVTPQPKELSQIEYELEKKQADLDADIAQLHRFIEIREAELNELQRRLRSDENQTPILEAMLRKTFFEGKRKLYRLYRVCKPTKPVDIWSPINRDDEHARLFESSLAYIEELEKRVGPGAIRSPYLVYE